MGDGADELAVLDDGAAGHALDDAAGGLQQGLVRDPQQQVPPVRPAGGVDLEDLHGVVPGGVIADGGADAGLTGVHLVGAAHGDGLAEPALTGLAEYALGRVAQQLHAALRPVAAAPQLPRMAASALGDGHDLGRVGGACRHLHQHPAAAVYPVTQRTEFPGGGIIPGDGADAGNALL